MLPQRVGLTTVYHCGEEGARFEIVTRTGPGEIALWLPPQFGRPYLVLGQTRATSGARYEGDGVLLWAKDTEAWLEVGGADQGRCRADPRRSTWEHAKLSGVDFRAVGHQPGWTLEIRKGRQLRFSYGDQSEVTTTCPAPVSDNSLRQTIYEATDGEHLLTVLLEGAPCRDRLSGEQFSTRVEVTLDRRTFQGCGRPLH